MTLRPVVLYAALVGLAGLSPAEAQTPWTSAQEQRIESKVLGETRVVRVWTPPGYATSSQRYPVLYLTDADAQMFHTTGTVDFLARQTRMPPMIVVGLTNTDRTRDLTPTRGGINGMAATFPTSGGADAFLRFFESELVPWVERTYRTQPYRVFAGHSFGGLLATHAFLSRPGLFNALIAVSPTLRWDDDLPLRKARDFVAAHAGRSLDRTFLFTIGSEGEENGRAFDELKTILGAHRIDGFRWEAWRFPDEDHGSVVLPSHVAALRALFVDWRLPTDSNGRYTGSIDDVRSHYRRLSARMGYAVSAPEDRINAIGYQYLATNDMDAALAFFRYNVQAYPDSANVHDSLGEGLEAAGDLDGALAAYETAVKRGQATKDPYLETFEQHRDALRAKRSTRSSSRR
jgi:predicted alpha/beta superfamily hydrolase